MRRKMWPALLAAVVAISFTPTAPAAAEEKEQKKEAAGEAKAGQQEAGGEKPATGAAQVQEPKAGAAGAAEKPEAAEKAPPPPKPGDPLQVLLDEADALYRQRHLPGKAEESMRKAEQAVKMKPDNYDALAKLSRAMYYISTNMPNGKEKALLGHRGYKTGLKAIKADPERVEGHFYACVNLGMYSEGVGILTSIKEGNKAKFEKLMYKAIAIDDTFQEGGPLLTKARFLASLPWPMRDREESRKIIALVKKRFPKNPRADLFLADTYIDEGKDEEALKILRDLVKRLPQDAYEPAEGETIKRWALERLDDLEE